MSLRAKIGIFLLQSSFFVLGFFLQKNNTQLQALNNLGYSVYLSRGAGLTLATIPGMIVFPVCRHTLTYLKNKSKIFRRYFPEDTIDMHIFISYTLLFWSLIHLVNHYLNFYNAIQIGITDRNLHYTIVAGVTGHLMFISLFFIFSFSVYYFRKKFYELFFYFHHFFILFFMAFFIHGIGCFVRTNTGKCVPYYSSAVFSPFLLGVSCPRFSPSADDPRLR